MLPLKKYASFFLPLLVFGSLIGLSVLINDNHVASNRPQVAATHVASKPTPSNLPQLPQTGTPVKFGVYLQDSDSPSKQEALLNRKFNLMAWFSTWDKPLVNNKLKYACKNGYVPAITWESWTGPASFSTNPYPLSSIASGQFDSLIRQQMQALKQACPGQKVIIRFDHEMNKRPFEPAWYPWQEDPTNYVNAWRHVVGISHEINPNVLWVWSANRGNQYAPSYYPGDQWVDYVGITLNLANFNHPDRKTFAAFYEQNHQVLASFHKPIIVTESGVAEVAPLQKSRWLQGMLDYISNSSDITAFMMINYVQHYPITGDYADYRLNSSSDALQTLKNGLPLLDNKDRKE